VQCIIALSLSTGWLSPPFALPPASCSSRSKFFSVWKRLLAVVVMHNSQCLLCCFSSTIDTCHCCYHWRIACGIYKTHLPVFLSLVALAVAIAITAGWLLLPLTKKYCLLDSHCWQWWNITLRQKMMWHLSLQTVIADRHCQTCQRCSSRHVAPVARELDNATGLMTALLPPPPPSSNRCLEYLKCRIWRSSYQCLIDKLISR